MRTKMMCLSLLLMLTLFSRFAAYAAPVNDGDMAPTSRAEWWWKYILPAGYDPHPNWVDAVQVGQVFVGSDAFDAAGNMTTPAVFAYKNTTNGYVKCGGSVVIVHTILASNGSILSSQAMAKALLPAQFAPGQTFQIRGTAFTPAKLRGFTHVFQVQER